MTADAKTMKRLKAAAAKATEFAAAAKEGVREAKARLKHARKLFKAAKKAAKQARRKVDAASAVAVGAKPALKAKSVLNARPAPKPLLKAAVKPPIRLKPAVRAATAASKPKRRVKRASKPDSVPPPETMRSAAEVAKSVIERLHSPPPLLPPTPAIPTPEPESEPGS
jgi:hypothetical protein